MSRFGFPTITMAQIGWTKIQYFKFHHLSLKNKKEYSKKQSRNLEQKLALSSPRQQWAWTPALQCTSGDLPPQDVVNTMQAGEGSEKPGQMLITPPHKGE